MEPVTGNESTFEERFTLFGLDGEMSSADLETGGKLIQAGAAAWADEPGGPVDVFTRLIRHDEMEWSERAFMVHGITKEEIAAAPRPEEVDSGLREFLISHGATPGQRTVVPIGLNVGSFDMPFFRDSLPGASSLIARRCVDLNSLLFTFSGWDPYEVGSNFRDFGGWKRSMKNAANSIIEKSGLVGREHDAGYDAAQALIGWWWLRGHLVELTERSRDLAARLEKADPMIALLGKGLVDRLSRVDGALVGEVLAALGPSTNARRWFGTRTPVLGCSPLEALLAGRGSDVVAFAQASL